MIGTISKVRQEVLRVEWKIKDFLSLKPESVGSAHVSPQFRLSDDAWSLIVYPHGEEDAKDSIGLYLRLDNSSSSSVAICTFAIKKTDGSLHFEIPFTWKFQDRISYGCSGVLLKSYLLQKKDEFLLDGALTFCCVLQKVPPTEVINALSVDLKKLRVSSAHSDLTIKLKSKEYRAHSAVLAARSDVFASALNNDTLEKETGIIKIEDCDSDSFGEFLQHLYTGHADINENNVFHLFKTADKYWVRELKSHCVAFLMENMSVDNVCDAIALAHDHEHTGLKNFCQDFFCSNVSSILVTSDWASLMESHCDTVAELLKHVAPKLTVKK